MWRVHLADSPAFAKTAEQKTTVSRGNSCCLQDFAPAPGQHIGHFSYLHRQTLQAMWKPMPYQMKDESQGALLPTKLEEKSE